MSRKRERTLLIVGAGGLGQDVAEIASMTGRYTKIAFLDDVPTLEKERRYNIVGNTYELGKFVGEYGYCIAAVSSNKLRMKVHQQIKELGFEIPILIHPTAIVHPLASLECGDIIRAMCFVSSGVDIRECVLLNIGCKIDHNCVIGEGSHIPMGCIVRNEVVVDSYSTFKSNAVVE